MVRDSGEFILPVGANAEPDTCGSCKFFKRLGADYGPAYASGGRCNIKMPPTMFLPFAVKPYVDGDEGRDRIKDTDRCDLHRPDGRVYIVQRRIGP